MNTRLEAAGHWRHEPWPWLLMAGPAAVIVAGVITTYLAVGTSDGMVADDYYKRGLAINQTLARDANARQLGLRAQMAFTAEYNRVAITLNGTPAATGPLLLRLAHPGRPVLDRVLPLTTSSDGLHGGAFPVLTAGRWRITLEDQQHTWRLTGEVVVPGTPVILLSPRE